MRFACFKPRFRLAACSMAVVLLVPVRAAAQGVQAPPVAETIFRWLNFALVFGLGGWWLWRNVKDVFRRNAEKIASAIGEAEHARRAAQDRLRAAEEKLAGLERESAEMRQRARLDSQAETARIRKQAQEEVERIGRAADAEIHAAEMAAQNRLREMAIEWTIGFAREQVAKRLTPEMDLRLVAQFVEAMNRAGGSL